MWQVCFERALLRYLMERASAEGETFRTTAAERDALVSAVESAIIEGEVDDRLAPFPVDWVPMIGWHSGVYVRNVRTHVDVIVARTRPPLDHDEREWELDVRVEFGQGMEYERDLDLGMMMRRSVRLEQWMQFGELRASGGLRLPGWLRLIGWEPGERDEGPAEDGRWLEGRTYRATVTANLDGLLGAAPAAGGGVEELVEAVSDATFLVTKGGLKLVTKDGKKLVVK